MAKFSTIVQHVTDHLTPFIAIFGVYLILHGHLTPGGGFQGGAILATGVALVVLTLYDVRPRKDAHPDHTFHNIETTGAMLFVALALIGLVFATFFFNFFPAEWGAPVLTSELIGGSPGANSGEINSAGTIMPMNIAVGMKVFAGLSAVVYLMWTYGNDDDVVEVEEADVKVEDAIEGAEAPAVTPGEEEAPEDVPDEDVQDEDVQDEDVQDEDVQDEDVQDEEAPEEEVDA